VAEFPETGSALAVVTRESALAAPYSVAASIFRYRPPVLHLRPAEQELLAAALGGKTDAELRALAILMIHMYPGYRWYIEVATSVEITIDIDSTVPQFEQLIEQVKAAVIAGLLKPGDALPSIRQLANDLELNSKTVAKAYKLLERDSIIEAKGYRGTYVHPRAKANCKFNLQEWTLRKLSETIAELREAGVTDSEIRNAFAGAISRQPPAK
jgi:GntR family transcriptional regulator